jgi:2-oxoglutarate dehydrogenase E1 component
MHIKNVEERDFIRQWLQANENHAKLSPEEKKHVLQRLIRQ